MPSGHTIGDWIDGRFEVYDIHAGGMGIVYVVYDHHGSAGRRVLALKTLRDGFLDDDRQTKRFIAECETWIQLEKHHHLVHAYAVQQIAGKPYVLMELVTGGDLGQWIGTPRLDLPQALRFGIQFCLGMEHAVQKGLRCHRDIKPANLLVTEGGTLKITDFGLAHIREDELADTSRLDPIPLAEIVEAEVFACADEDLGEDELNEFNARDSSCDDRPCESSSTTVDQHDSEHPNHARRVPAMPTEFDPVSGPIR